MTLVAESKIAGLESMIRVIRPQTMILLHGPTPRLTKSLVHFQIQSHVLLKFEEPAPKALRLAKLTGISSNLGIPWPTKHKRFEIGIYSTLAEQNLIQLSFL